MKKKILLLGSGELGKEFVIACQRLGQEIIACDSYAGAPAMQVADGFEVIDMLSGAELDQIVAKHQPDIIVPEIEAIRTERLYEYEQQGIQVVPSARAVNFTMNRQAVRDLAAKELGLNTAKYLYAKTMEEFKAGVAEIGLPCVVKPLMSSSGKGQSYIRNEDEVEAAWEYALAGSRGDLAEVIIEEFIDFQYEITLLTVTQSEGETLFCAPIGHLQERGDYQESWQPIPMKTELLEKAKEMAREITAALKGEGKGSGIWGVEFFIGENDVWFSELSPRPHDTGMVTLAQTQNLNQFELHARAVLGLAIPEIKQLQIGASAVILANDVADHFTISGIDDALKLDNLDLRIFGKPTTRQYRRMGVALSSSELSSKGLNAAREIAKKGASLVKFTSC